MKSAISLRTLALTLLLGVLLSACGGEATNNATGATTPTKTQASPTSVSCQAGSDIYAIVSDQSEATYAVQEQFLSRDLPNTAEGKTKDVTGNFVLQTSDNKLTTIAMQVDLRTLKSDEERRDNAIRERWLESNKYPYAKFSAKDVQAVSGTYSEGQEVSFEVTGDMTIRETTRQETFKVTGKRSGDTISGTATGNILMKNYGFEAPNIANFLTVKDGVTLKINFVSSKASCTKS